MISARDEDIMKMRGFEVGLDDYLTKPFSPNELVARVKGRLSRYESLVGDTSSGQKIMEDRGIIIDQTARRIFVNDSEVVMTNKEFDLLVLFMSNPNKVLVKMIYLKIFGILHPKVIFLP